MLCLALRKSHPQGLATLSMASARDTLESLSQLSTLLGFPLQSFPPPGRSVDPFESTSPLLRFSPNPIGFGPALQRLAPFHEAVPLLAPRGLVWVGARALLGLSDLSGFSLTSVPRRKRLPLHAPLSSFLSARLTTNEKRNLRGFRTQMLGSLPP